MLAVGLSYMAFIVLRWVPSMSIFWRLFIINDCWILSKAFSASIKMIMWFVFFYLLMWFITLIDLQILKNSCIPWINPAWSWYRIHCWIWFASILLKIFVSMFTGDIGLWFSFLVVSFFFFCCHTTQYVNHELPDVQAGFRKGRDTRDQIANIHWIIEKAREFQQNIYFCLIGYFQSLWLCGSQQTVENSSTDGYTRPPDLPPEKSVCRSRSNS